ncbi:MAG: LPS export ABC transporter periplasmic protein LptC [Granulosicoccaceae bacterium]
MQGRLTRMLSRYWLLVPLLLLVLVARNWVEDTPTGSAAESTIDMQATHSDYYLEDFVTQKFSADGALEYEVSGDTLLHYPEDNRSEIIKPDVTLHRPPVTWTVMSEKGLLVKDPETFTLQGNVRVERTAQNQAMVQILAKDLSIDTQSNLLSTTGKVTIDAETWQLEADGLQSSIDSGKLNLLSNVKGRYEVAN